MDDLLQTVVCLLIVALQTLARATPTTTANATFGGVPPGSRPTAPYEVFSVTAPPGSDAHFLSWTASGNIIYLGGSSTASCSVDGSLCSNGSSLAFVDAGTMYVLAPGGQMAYIAADGHLGFTRPHSAGDYPLGAELLPFHYEKGTASDSFGRITTSVWGATGFMACPIRDSPDVYAVFAAITNATNVPSDNVRDCFPFDALTLDYNQKPVMEYF